MAGADKVVRVEIQGGADSFIKAVLGAGKATDDLQRGVTDLGRSIQSSFKGAASELGPFGSALVAIGPAGLVAAAGIGATATAVGALVGFIGAATKGLVELGGHLSDLSAQTGLSTTTLQELRFAGALVGVSLEDAANAVGKMQKAITAGSTVFARLGLDLNQLRSLKVADQFDEVAGAIKAIADPTQQAAAAMEAFGKGGAAILPLIKSDTAAAREEFQRLGLAIGEDTVKAADKLGDELDKVGFAFEGVKNQLAAGIVESGALTAATEALKGVLGTLATFLNDNKDLIRGFFALGLGAAKELASFLPTIKTAFAGVVQLLGAANPLIAKAIGDAGADLKFLLDSAAQFQAMQERIAKATAAAGAVGGPAVVKKFVSQQDLDAAAKLAAEVERLADAERKATAEAIKRSNAEDAAVQKHNEEVQKRQSAAQESIFGTSAAAAVEAERSFTFLAKALGATIEVADDGKRSYEGLGDAINRLSEGELRALETQLVKLEKASRDDADTNDDIATTLGAVREALRNAGVDVAEFRGHVEKLTDKTAVWVEALGHAAGAMADLFGDASTQADDFAKRASKAFEQVARGAQAVKAAGGLGTTGGKLEAVGAGAGAAGAFFGPNSKTGGTLSGIGKGAAAGASAGVPGIIIGAAIGGIAGFFGAKKRQKQELKDLTDGIVQQFGSIQKAEAIAKKYGIALDKALDSKKPAKITQAINDLNAALEKRQNLEQGLASAQENVGQLQDLTKELNNPKLSAAVQALAQKVSDELLKAGLGFAASGPLRNSEAFKADQSISAATAGTVGGLRQAGVVDQGVIDAAGQVAGEVQKKAFEDAKAAGLDDAAAQKASFGAVSDLLREQLNASLASGRELDANTKQLIEEAKANGIDILADPAIEAVSVQKQILGAIESGNGIKGAGSNVIDARNAFDGVQRFATGGIFRQPTFGIIGEKGPEAVVPLMPSMLGTGLPAGSAALNGTARPGGGPVSVTGGDLHLTVQGSLDSAALAQVKAAFRRQDEDLMFTVKRALGR